MEESIQEIREQLRTILTPQQVTAVMNILRPVLKKVVKKHAMKGKKAGSFRFLPELTTIKAVKVNDEEGTATVKYIKGTHEKELTLDFDWSAKEEFEAEVNAAIKNDLGI